MRKRRSKPKPQRKTWQPLELYEPDPDYLERRQALMDDAGAQAEPVIAVALNDVYQVVVMRQANGLRHLSIHRHDRRALRDWRHLQQIKSEVLGPDAMAVEIFPPDNVMFDTSNEYHLWEIPPDDSLLGFEAGFQQIYGHEVTQDRVHGVSKIRQRPIQPGLGVYEKGEQ